MFLFECVLCLSVCVVFVCEDVMCDVVVMI